MRYYGFLLTINILFKRITNLYKFYLEIRISMLNTGEFNMTYYQYETMQWT